ncbi:hypothetical protein PM082_011259 [Marasmius tenuissimus]|nr:hypothetical protein PM082_011259 [Marasmius tenuissimus]
MSLDTIYSFFPQNSSRELPKVLSDPRFFITRCSRPHNAEGYLAYSTRVLPAFNVNLYEEDEECKVVSLVMLKCIGGSEHEIGGVIVRMPGPEEAQAILTFE